MVYSKRYDNGLRLIISTNESVYSVSTGVIVKTGSANETESENGISHFIEHNLFKGTTTRSAFEISDCIDRIGAQINAFTSKELTCYYTKSTSDYFKETLEILSDIFFNSTFMEEEIKKERGVVIEEINMSEDTPEELCFDLLAESYFGKEGLGRTILGPAKNIKKFNADDIRKYMDKHYTSKNTVISVSGKIDVEKTIQLVDEFFAKKFKNVGSVVETSTNTVNLSNIYKSKPIEQTHIAMSIKGISIDDDRSEALTVANIVLGGGMSSRLFQKIREEMGLAYSVYSYASQYKDCGVIDFYAGVSTEKRDQAVRAIIDEINRLRDEGITDSEFMRGKEQMKSAFVFGRESTASQMLLYGKNLIYLDEEFDYDKKLKIIENLTKDEVEAVIKEIFQTEKIASATVGPKRSALKI